MKNYKENSKKKEQNKKIKIILIYLIASIIILLTIFFIIKNIKEKDTFDFKTISSNCTAFHVTGSIAYDKNKSSIYISKVDYCGGDDDQLYQEIIERTQYKVEKIYLYYYYFFQIYQ